jgi:hypothetical protein
LLEVAIVVVIVWLVFGGSLLSLHFAIHAKYISILLSFNGKLKSADFLFFAGGGGLAGGV